MPREERNFFGELNYITKIVHQTCNGKWDMLLETALPAAGKSLFVLLVPSPNEVLEEYLHPRSSRKQHKSDRRDSGRRRRGRTGLRRWASRFAIPDVDQMIAELLPVRGYFEGRRVGTAEKWFWTGIDVLDRVAWWFLVADMGANFIHYWASNIMEARYCNNPAALLLEVNGQYNGAGFTGNLFRTDYNPFVERIQDCTLDNVGQIDPVPAPFTGNTIFQCNATVFLAYSASTSNPSFRIVLRILPASGGIVTFEGDAAEMHYNSSHQYTLDITYDEPWLRAYWIIGKVGSFGIPAGSYCSANATAWGWEPP